MKEMFECYELVLKHYVMNGGHGEKVLIEEPIWVEQIYDRKYGGAPIIINRMFDEMKSYVLTRIGGEQDE